MVLEIESHRNMTLSNYVGRYFQFRNINVHLCSCYRDAERKRKVKELYGMLATQEGDYKASKRTKKNNNPF